MQRRVILGTALVLGAAMTNAAPDRAMETVLVTGTLAPRETLTSSVSVIDAQQIESLNKRSLAQLLQTVPGLLVEQQGGPGGLTAVSIRGGEANFTLVLLDGIPVNDPTNFRGGGFDFANLDPNMVERIEIVRGAQSAIYGSDAVAGVINIITRRPLKGHSQSVYAAWGEDDYSDLGVSALGRVGEFEYTLEANHSDEGEPVPGSSRDSDSVNLRLGWRPTPGHELNAGYRYLDGDRKTYPEQSGGPRYALSDALDKSDYTQKILFARWAGQLSTTWNSAVTVSRFEAKDRYTSPGIPPFLEVPPNAADTDFTRDRLQWIHSLQVAQGYELNVGADYQHEEGKSDGYLEFFGNQTPTDFDLDRDVTGVFADIAASPLQVLLLQGSLRYDDPEDFDSETSWHAGAKYSVGSGITIAANWGEAYKLPSFFALGHALVGNPDLQPEQGESWDLGIAWEVNTALRFEVTGFNNDYQDLVDFDNESFRNVNRKRVQTSGVELQAYWLVLDELSVRAQGTYTDIDVKSEDTVLTGRPQWTASVVTRWQFANRWHTTLDYLYYGEQWAGSRHTGEQVTTQLDSYQRLDWVLQWQMAKEWQWELSVDNVLDENYQTAVGFPGLSRAFRMGVRFNH